MKYHYSLWLPSDSRLEFAAPDVEKWEDLWAYSVYETDVAPSWNNEKFGKSPSGPPNILLCLAEAFPSAFPPVAPVFAVGYANNLWNFGHDMFHLKSPNCIFLLDAEHSETFAKTSLIFTFQSIKSKSSFI